MARGGLAQSVHNRLLENNIKASGFIVDDKYYTDGMYLCDLPVLSFSQVVNKGKFNLVMGVGNYALGYKKQKEFAQICNVFCIVDIPYRNNIITNEMLEANIDMYENAANIFEDRQSVECMVAWINCCLSDRAEYCFPMYHGQQTYFNNDVFNISEKEVFLDIGAYTGDTIRQFYGASKNRFSFIYAIEGDKDNFSCLQKTVRELKIENKVNVYNEICKDKMENILFTTDYKEKEGYIVYTSSDGTIKSITLDILLKIRKKITLLKINFPEALSVLKGAEAIIKADKPKLTIMVGWGGKMVAEIPSYIKTIVPEYKIYLRYISAMPTRIMMIAACE